MSVVKNGCCHSGLKTLKLSVSQERIIEINLFFDVLIKLIKAKSCFNSFWVLVVKNGGGLFGLEALKYAVSQG